MSNMSYCTHCGKYEMQKDGNIMLCVNCGYLVKLGICGQAGTSTICVNCTDTHCCHYIDVSKEA
jgi:hypothetical protein